MGLNEILKIGTRIKEYRKKIGISQKEMAKRLDIPYSTYSNYENNNRLPNQETLEKIMTELGISTEDLFIINDKTQYDYMYYLDTLIEWAEFNDYATDLSHSFEKELENGGGQSLFLEKKHKLYEFTPEEMLSISDFMKDVLFSFMENIIARKENVANIYPKELKRIVDIRNCLAYLSHEKAIDTQNPAAESPASSDQDE